MAAMATDFYLDRFFSEWVTHARVLNVISSVEPPTFCFIYLCTTRVINCVCNANATETWKIKHPSLFFEGILLAAASPWGGGF